MNIRWKNIKLWRGKKHCSDNHGLESKKLGVYVNRLHADRRRGQEGIIPIIIYHYTYNIISIHLHVLFDLFRVIKALCS